MLAVHTPAPVYPMVRNEQLDELQKNHLYEICTWPAYYSDEYCMNSLRKNADPNVVLYIALMKGITPIVTIGDHKAFVADFSKPEPKKKDRKLPRFGSKVKDKLENTLRLKRSKSTNSS
tara:strand:+ start:484 stop:840 length:357 start_codon:yes stop_codon:yes gene_type:complete